jgi:hypothetical protein
LWYNYYFFEDCYKYVSLDVVENQHYITEWVESIIQNGVKSAAAQSNFKHIPVESIIQNGVKDTKPNERLWQAYVEDTIQNGVKKTDFNMYRDNNAVKDTIQYGAIKTTVGGCQKRLGVKNTIQNGVKKTYSDKIPHEYDWTDQFTEEIDDVIENGVKETNHVDIMKFFDNKMDNVLQNGIKESHDDVYHHKGRVEGVIKNGIKETNPHLLEIYNPMNFEPEIKEMKRMNEVNIVLEKGIKEVKELPDKSGELMGYGEYYTRQKDRTYPHNDIVSDVISDGIKETNWRKVDNFPEYENRVIENGKLIKKD